MTRGHAEALFPMIDAVLAEAGAEMSDLTRIGVCTGPGSFTGIRVGVAAARGLALGCGIPAVGISRFEALSTGGGAVRLPGRKGVVYVQEFDGDKPSGDPYMSEGEAEERLADPLVIASLAASREPAAPAPLYLRDADAARPREAPPTLLDP